jgi:hypothetical protein
MTATDTNTFEQKSCANCGATLSARYCAQCGQDSHVTLSVRHFAEEAVEGITHFDSTFWRTFVPLLFKPGLITERYLAGKRKFYAPPVRTYLVISIVYFLLSSFVTTMHVNSMRPSGQPFGAQDCAEFARGMHWLSGLVSDIEGSCVRSQRDQGRALSSTVVGLLPKVMFFVLPLVALVQHWMYRRRRPLYVQNLIFVLHFQSFYFLVGSMLFLIALATAPLFHTTAEDVANSLNLPLYAWAGVYLFIANRRVYQAGAFKAVVSILGLAVAYTILWAIAVSVAGMYAMLHT